MENQENENQENEIEEVLTKPKRQITDAQRQHLANIRVKAQEKKAQLKEITLKAKLCKTIQKKDLSEEYDKYIEDQKELYLLRQQSQKLQIQQPEPEPEPKTIKQKKIKKVIIESSDSEEEIVYVKAKKQPQQLQQQIKQESFDELTYKSAQERLHLRAIDEQIKNNINGYHNAMMQRQY